MLALSLRSWSASSGQGDARNLTERLACSSATEGEVIIHIDDRELSLGEFGRMLRVRAGWGMRIAFVPKEFISENPKVEIRKPKRRKR